MLGQRTMTRAMKTSDRMTTIHMMKPSPGSAVGWSSCLFLLMALSLAGSCLGYRVSMNCSIYLVVSSVIVHNTETRLAYLGASSADGQEVGVARIVLLGNAADVSAEDVANGKEVLRRLEHNLAGITLGDLDVPLENSRVAEDELHSSNGHGLGNGNKVEAALVTHSSHVEETLLDVLEGVEDHLGNAVESLLSLAQLKQVLPLVDVLAPNLLGVPATAVLPILVDITDNVGLLQELAHRLGQRRALGELGVGELRGDKESGETLADEASNVMAVELIVLNLLHAVLDLVRILCVISHTVAHLKGQVLDDFVVYGLKLLELGNDNIKVLKQLGVLFLALVELPAVNFHGLVELAQHGGLLLQGDGHIIFDGIQTSEDEIEESNRDEQLGVQLLYNHGKTAASHVEESEALFEGFALFAGVAPVHGLVPELPVKCISAV